jgi:ribosomal-protein-alanine N-acetyltransferase
MSALHSDPVDRIMEVMEVAFDPAWGEAWNRRQVGDALTLGGCSYLLVDERGALSQSGPAAGFLLSRQAADEEELLLIAVRPEFRRRGIAQELLACFVAEARIRGISRIFLEMREGNPAALLYLKCGFEPVGRRPNYYNRGRITGIDAITFALPIA